MAHLTLDFETASEVSIKTHGAHAYARHPSTRLLSVSWKWDHGLIGHWCPDDGGQPSFLPALDACLIEAHNVAFERAIWEHVCVARMGWPAVDPLQWRDTMAACGHRALPLALEDVGVVLDLRHQKMNTNVLDRIERPKATFLDFEELYIYNKADVRSQHELASRVGDLPGPELALWQLDQEINNRGVKIDREAVLAGHAICDDFVTKCNARMAVLTNGAVEKVTQIERLKLWLGMTKKAKLGKEALASWIRDPTGLPPTGAEALGLRQAAGKTSVAKLDAMLRWACEDDRMRGVHQYYGAHTGRWGGRGPQLQNLPVKAVHLQKVKPEDLIAAIKTRDFEYVEMLYGEPTVAVSTAIRSMLIAEQGHRFVVGDFAQVEARVLFALAGARKALDILCGGNDIYCAMAADIYKRPITKADAFERDIGKKSVLGLGFQMGAAKFRLRYAQKETEEFCERVVRVYREEFAPEVPRLWRAMERAAVRATSHPGLAVEAGLLEFRVINDGAGSALTCRLPSGRRLFYHEPKVVMKPMPWDEMDERPGIEYSGFELMENGARMWTRVQTYGGKLTENAVQATARDLEVGAMFRAEAAGYPIVMHSHDEIVCEVPVGAGSPKGLQSIMEASDPWAKDWPITAECWEGQRYRK